ncbi:hypothetical protein BgAZ_501850 [Babesia gibsoni]|uniref:Uncharacterized protein n=1 Tax=Babesia gibsoni TaxID=33632 RepID=A0AAD8LI68_BABGI|nr:hypothetical protein BgAZ_501850 [Babesia gibsoni]
MEKEVLMEDSTSSASTSEDMAALLLKGWAMMSETCSTCRDVPLMRSREGILRCCRCQSETQTKASVGNGLSAADQRREEAVSSLPVGCNNKYHIVDEGGLESSLVKGIHSNDGYKAAPKTDVEVRKTKPAKFDDRRYRQLCLLRLELNLTLDRHTMVLHNRNESGCEDIDKDGKLLDNIEKTLQLLDIVERKI